MIDEEVEMVLREIRERVVSQPLAEPPLARPAPAPGNGDGKPLLIANADPGIRSSESLARLNAHLTTTARAWDRLPPIFSNRSGVAARIEVWIKARLKSLSRWFTWEQVNFNAAVHHALGDTLQTLANQEATISALRAQLASEAQAHRSEIELLHTEIAQLRQRQQNETNALRGEVEAARIRAADQETQLRAEIETQKTEAAARLSEVANELREREDHLENEQRVCFKQLSLETSEAVVSNDRAQRRTGARLDEMNQRIKQIEEST
jgi:hypothetical protein